MSANGVFPGLTFTTLSQATIRDGATHKSMSQSITVEASTLQIVAMHGNSQIQKGITCRPAPDPSLSIFVIGMRGAGKTTSGRWIASLLSRAFVDLDEELELRSGLSCSDFVRQRGWDAFRAEELAVLRDVMHSRPSGCVFSCGGGIVETSEARSLLKNWPGLVIQVHRNTDAMVSYLLIDKTRPVYTEQIRQVYERRKPFLEECSNVLYLSTHAEEIGKSPPRDLVSLLARIYEVESKHPATVDNGLNRLQVLAIDGPIFSSHSWQNVENAMLDALTGCDALEMHIRVTKLMCLDEVALQIARIRRNTIKPLVLSLDVSEAESNQRVSEICQLGDKMRVEFVVVEPVLPPESLQHMKGLCNFTQIVNYEEPSSCTGQKLGVSGEKVRILCPPTVEESEVAMYNAIRHLRLHC